MAPAIQTTKRKFYKLLDGLSSSQSTHARPKTTTDAPSTTTIPGEHSAKKSRLSLDHVDNRPSTAVSSSSAAAKTPSTSHTLPLKESPSTRAAPNYQPYSQTAFLDRLKTFSNVTLWTYKPAEISELQWAKRGWVCEGNKVDVVACKGGCEARVVVRLARGRERAKAFGEAEEPGISDAPEVGSKRKASEISEGEDLDWLADADEALVKKYAQLIVDGHHDGCLWRKGGCKDDIYRIRLADAAGWQAELKERYESLVKIASALPERLKAPASKKGTDDFGVFETDRIQAFLSAILLPGPDGDDKPATAVSDSDTTPATSTPPINSAAATLALFGWSGTLLRTLPLATCTRCFERIGLWLYSSNPSTKAVPAHTSGIADDNIMRFELGGRHRDHCPWICGETQAAANGLAGWEVLVQRVKWWGVRGESLRDNVEEVVGEVELPVGSPESVQRAREDLDKGDRERDSKLARLKRAFTIKKENRKSWKSVKSTGQ